MTRSHAEIGKPQSEADFQRAVLDAAAWHGWHACHTRKATVRAGQIATPTSVPGWPDLVLWHTEHHVVMFVELKTDKGRLSEAQVEVLGSLSSAGANVAIWRPKDWDAITALLRAPHEPVVREDLRRAAAGVLSAEEDKRWLAAEVRAERTADAADRGDEA